MSIIRFVGGYDGNVFIVETDRVRLLGIYEWGAQTARCATLAHDLLHELIGASLAMRLHRRFLHRTVTTWPKAKPWTASAAELMGTVDDITRIERETAADIARMAREPMRGMIVAGGLRDESEWAGGKPPVLVPNKPKERS